MIPEEQIRKVNRDDSYNLENIQHTLSKREELENDRGDGQFKALLILALIIVAIVAIFYLLDLYL